MGAVCVLLLLLVLVCLYGVYVCVCDPLTVTVGGAVGCPACLPCPLAAAPASCGPLHSVVWRRRDARLLAVDARRNRSHAADLRAEACGERRWGLLLRDLRPRDAGAYRCEATYVRPLDGCPLLGEALLTVAPPLAWDASRGDGGRRRLLERRDAVGPLVVGDALALDCDGQGATWWSGGRSLGVAALRTTVTESHRDWELRCGCEGDAGGGPTVRVLVAAPPRSAALSVAGEVVEGGELRAVCVASGAFPAASVTWHWGGGGTIRRWQRDAVRREGRLLATTSVLRVPARRHLHGASLLCSAANEASRRPVVSAAATVSVLHPPGRTTLVATPWTPRPSAPWSLRCLTPDPGRPPAASFEWTLDSRPLVAATPWPWLRLSVATRGVYSCRAVNSVGPGAASRPLLVEPLEAPRLLRPPGELRLREGDAFPAAEAPRCDARGLPFPSVLWRRRGETLVVAVGDALALPSPVDRKVAGVYECEASNAVGVVTGSVAVTVLFAPECSVYPRGRRRLHCCSRGNPRGGVTFSWTLPSGAAYGNCSHVEAAVPGEYVCRPRNVVGEGRPCAVTVTAAGDEGAETSLWLALGALASVAALVLGRRRHNWDCRCSFSCQDSSGDVTEQGAVEVEGRGGDVTRPSSAFLSNKRPPDFL